MLNQISNYIQNKTFYFTVYKDKIHIQNYQRIVSLEENHLSFTTQNKKINISGNNFILKKLLDKELLISGNIHKIEVINE